MRTESLGDYLYYIHNEIARISIVLVERNSLPALYYNGVRNMTI